MSLSPEEKKDKNCFFSVAFDLISLDSLLQFELYVNSSTIEGVERFIKIYPKNRPLTTEDVGEFKRKYRQLYVPESQRGMYFNSLVDNQSFPPERKTDVLKDSAIKHLTRIFDTERELNTQLLEEAVEGCKDAVNAMVDVIEDYSISQLREMIAGLSFHDFYTYDHSVNVSMYCISILKNMRPEISKDELSLIGMGGILHDIGKINVPTSIINNTGKLTDEMFEVIKKHPGDGVNIITEQLSNSSEKQSDLEIIMRVIGEHHENVNGTGYPNKLKGDQIHFYAKICAVADFFDAITTKRSYSEVVTADEAIAMMEKSVGKKIDREIFEALAEDVTRVYGRKKATRQLPDTFEPSVPHGELPFERLKAQKMNVDLLGSNEKKSYGKVKKN